MGNLDSWNFTTVSVKNFWLIRKFRKHIRLMITCVYFCVMTNADFCMTNAIVGIFIIIVCLNFFQLHTWKPNLGNFSIYSNKFFHNFHFSESSFTCPWLRASGLARRLLQYLLCVIYLFFHHFKFFFFWSLHCIIIILFLIL